MWDTRETIRTDLEKIIKKLVDASQASEYEFISKLLEHPGIVDIVQTLNDDRRDISVLAGGEEEEGTRGDDIRKLRGLIQEQRQEYQEQKRKHENRKERPQLEHILRYIMDDESYARPDMVETILNTEHIMEALRHWRYQQDQELQRQAQDRLLWLLFPVMLREELGQNIWLEMKALVSSDLEEDPVFLRGLLRNKNIIEIGKDIRTGNDDGSKMSRLSGHILGEQEAHERAQAEKRKTGKYEKEKLRTKSNAMPNVRSEKLRKDEVQTLRHMVWRVARDKMAFDSQFVEQLVENIKIVEMVKLYNNKEDVDVRVELCPLIEEDGLEALGQGDLAHTPLLGEDISTWCEG